MVNEMLGVEKKVKVYDFFSGCGGTSCGLEQAGFEISMALDIDRKALDTFSLNFPDAAIVHGDICSMSPQDIALHIGARKDFLLFSGCAPCQPFSKQNNQKSANDPRRSLLTKFGEFVEYWLPDFLLIENVPGLQKANTAGPFGAFLELLKGNGYCYDYKVVPAAGYGVPQKRERLVLVASRLSEISVPPLSHGPDLSLEYTTVRDWISGLSPLCAGGIDPEDPDHQAASLSEINLKRIRSTPEGGSRESWPEELWLDCHKGHKGHTDVYGRLSWDKPASGLTTRCISLSNGRFGHPAEDRALSVREAACLQTFPRSFRFTGTLGDKAKQVGNAVPPLMATKLAQSFIDKLASY